MCCRLEHQNEAAEVMLWLRRFHFPCPDYPGIRGIKVHDIPKLGLLNALLPVKSVLTRSIEMEKYTSGVLH